MTSPMNSFYWVKVNTFFVGGGSKKWLFGYLKNGYLSTYSASSSFNRIPINTLRCVALVFNLGTV